MDMCSEDCDAVPLGEWFLVSQRNTLPLSSRVNQSKKNCCHIPRLLDHEYEGNVFLQKLWELLIHVTASCSTNPAS